MPSTRSTHECDVAVHAWIERDMAVHVWIERVGGEPPTLRITH